MSDFAELRLVLERAVGVATAAKLLGSVRPGLLLRKLFTMETVAQKPWLGLFPRRPRAVRRGRPVGLGQSRIGGLPELPAGTDWPQRKGKPAPFLAQINCAELATHTADTGLPPEGMLYFFHDLEFWKPGQPEESPLVIYSKAGASGQSTPAPAGLATVYPAFPVTFERQPTFPGGLTPEFEALQLSEAEEEAYFAALAEWERAHVWDGGRDTGCHQVGGHAGLIQEDVREEFAQAAGAADSAPEWRLLLQFDSDDDLGVMWGDGGRLYFGLRAADLQARRFERTQVIMQCY